MNKLITPAQSPYTLNLANVDTAQFAQSNVFLKCSGDGIVVNLPPQSEINGTPDFYVTSIASTGGCQVNFAAGEGVLNGSGGGVTDSIQVQGSQGMKPLGDGIWILK